MRRVSDSQESMSPESEDFLAEYRARVAGLSMRLHCGEPPTILRIGEDLVLRHERRRWRVSVIDDEYRRLMRASHVPALMALLHRPGERFPARVDELVSGLRHHEGDGPAAQLLKHCAMLLDSLPIDAWSDAAERMVGLLTECIHAAARVELRNLDDATRQLLERCGGARSRVVFVVCDDHQPRYRQLSKQYFAKLLGTDLESRPDGPERLVYAEHRDEEAALRLVAMQTVDRELALRIWGEKTRMQRDVLGDAARSVLEGFATPDAD